VHADAADITFLVSDHDPVPGLDRALREEDKSGNEIVDDALDADTDADADRQRAGDSPLSTPHRPVPWVLTLNMQQCFDIWRSIHAKWPSSRLL